MLVLMASHILSYFREASIRHELRQALGLLLSISSYLLYICATPHVAVYTDAYKCRNFSTGVVYLQNFKFTRFD